MVSYIFVIHINSYIYSRNKLVLSQCAINWNLLHNKNHLNIGV